MTYWIQIYILITFDDGYKDNFEIALPLLKNFNVNQFFIVTNYVGKNNWFKHDYYDIPCKITKHEEELKMF